MFSIKNAAIGSLLLISSPTWAQLGLTGGINFAKYSYAEKLFNVDRKLIMAYNLGLQYKKNISAKCYLLPELAYSGKGTRIYYSYPIGTTGPMKRVNRLNYLQLSIPVVAALPLDDTYDFEIGAGPFLSYLSGGHTKLVEFDDASEQRKLDKTDFKKIDIGLHFMLGFRMAKKLGFHLRYDWGLKNVQYHQEDPAIKTRNLSFNVSWIFSKTEQQ